jgi:hypothetical protein
MLLGFKDTHVGDVVFHEGDQYTLTNISDIHNVEAVIYNDPKDPRSNGSALLCFMPGCELHSAVYSTREEFLTITNNLDI